MVDERVVRNPAGATQQGYFAVGAVLFVWLMWTAAISAQEADRSRLYEPVYRVSKKATATPENGLVSGPIATEGIPTNVSETHPLDPALNVARDALDHIEENVFDYTCTLIKRERVHGELLDYEFMNCKIRHARQDESAVVPFSVYISFLKPDSVRGREVMYVDGYNDGKLTAHEGGFKGRFLPTVSLLPNSALAMRGNRYPITEIGILTLTRRLIEKGERDRKNGLCDVRLVDGAKVGNRVCLMLEVSHEDYKPQYDFHLARVFLDRELNMPIRYEAYGWPTQAGEKPPLLEEYTYMDIKVNVGLNDLDFDTKNSKYRF